jgi:hypothetical protein
VTDAASTAEVVRLSKLKIKDLFGRYSYEIPDGEGAVNPHIGILYGGNGTGKTTILKLLHHMVSSGIARGHKTSIAQIPFRSVVLEFSDGQLLIADRPDSNAGTFSMRLLHPSHETVAADFIVADGNRIPRESDHSAAQNSFLQEAGGRLGLTSYYLSDDRKLDSDVFPRDTPSVVVTFMPRRTSNEILFSYRNLLIVSTRDLKVSYNSL